MSEELRKLATIRKVASIQKIEGADFIELIKIDGWQCIAKVNEFKVGDYCVYFEIDSFLPIKPEFEFLRKSSYKRYNIGTETIEGFRLKTIKLKGNLSQGLALPISLILNNSNISLEEIKKHEEEYLSIDFADALEVVKYDPPLPKHLEGIAKGNFPSYIRKTNQERVQNLWDLYNSKYKEISFEVSLKLDGTSFTAYYNNGSVGVCSRNLEKSVEGEGLYSEAFRKYNLQAKFEKLQKNIAVQGELVGEGIQGNHENLKGVHLYVFDIFDIDNQRYLKREERLQILDLLNEKEEMLLQPIPCLDTITLNQFDTIDDILKYAEGSSLNPKVTREGLVFKSLDYVKNEILSFKVISNQFLLNKK